MNDQLNTLRHSSAHLLAAAVRQIWPDAKNAIGPAIDNGFYQDFDLGDVKFSDSDLPKIDQKMREIVKSWHEFEEREITKEEALKLFDWNEYKKELINEFASKGSKITVNDPGNFLDLCKGGHTGDPRKEIKHFKLLSIAGAYWRGDEKNKMLTRIYGTAFPSKEELEKHLWMIEEAKKRDHKKLGKELDLFIFSELVGPGLPLWTPKGTVLRELLADYVAKLRKEKGYVRVSIPHITKKELYETSGHWAKFANELFKIKSREGHEFAMKPMNCPHHTQIFASLPRSYKNMPQRYAETTVCYRDEQTGELSGLSRTRSFTQDDAHVFARHNQIKDEFIKIWDIIDTFYGTFGFKLRVRLSLHDPKNLQAYLGTPEMWQEAETKIREIAQERKANFFESVGEAAFYGPKVDFMASDSMGREHQVATIQLDINMPERFDLFCTNEKGEKERIVMIHAAIMGSIERFLSVLIEHLAGIFPVWLAPVQATIIPVSDRHVEAAQNAHRILLENDIRAELDDENKTLSNKIRRSTLQKVPYMYIIGDKEIEKSSKDKPSGSIRSRDGKDHGQQDPLEFIKNLKQHIEKYE